MHARLVMAASDEFPNRATMASLVPRPPVRRKRAGEHPWRRWRAVPKKPLPGKTVRAAEKLYRP